MSADFLSAVDWRRPWLAPFREVGEILSSSSDWRETANEMAAGTHNSRGHQIRFVPQSMLPDGTAYEAFIAETGMVPTRENLHDFFNALVWLTFPAIKVQLNARQAAEIAAMGVREFRGGVRDAATLFDENAALLVTRDVDLLEALRTHQWEQVFLQERDRFQAGTEIILFGHALMEKLVKPYKAITAHAWPVIVDTSYHPLSSTGRISYLDMRVAAQLTGGLQPGAFTPLPVLGVPGWWPDQDEAFYADKAVFRPRRKPA